MSFFLATKLVEDLHRYKEEIILNTNLKEDKINPKYVFVLGGDGTFLHAFHRFKTNPIYIHINKGTLGFFSNFTISDLPLIYEAINNNKLSYNKLSVLHAKLVANDKTSHFLALNEITISSIPKTLVANVFLNYHKFETFRGSGLLVSTPEGSSAYNKSLNGALLDHSLNVMQLTEIAGINSNSYRTLNSSLVLSDKYKISINLASLYKKINITVDNHLYEVSKFRSLDVNLNIDRCKMAYINKTSFLAKIKTSFLSV